MRKNWSMVVQGIRAGQHDMVDLSVHVKYDEARSRVDTLTDANPVAYKALDAKRTGHTANVHTFQIGNLTMDATFTILDIWGNEVASKVSIPASKNEHGVMLLYGSYYLKLEKTSPGTTEYIISGKSARRGGAGMGLTKGDMPEDSGGITYALIPAPNTDHALFEFNGNMLEWKISPNYEGPRDTAAGVIGYGALHNNSDYNAISGDGYYEVIISASYDNNGTTVSIYNVVFIDVIDDETLEVPDPVHVRNGIVITPVGLAATVSLDNAPTNVGPEITSYDINYGKSGGGTLGRTKNYVGATLTNAEIPNLSSGRWALRIRANNDDGSAEWSSRFTFATTNKPGAPRALSATPGRWITLDWKTPLSDGGSPLDRYEYRSSSNGGTTWSSWTATDDLDTNHLVEGLTNDREYTFEVRAINELPKTGPSSNQAIAEANRSIPPFSRGTNLHVWMQKARTYPFLMYNRQTFVDLKSLGFDVVRLPFAARMVDDVIEPYFLGYLDQIVDWAEEVGLYIVLDNHKFGLDKDNAEAYLVNMWPQIAERFKDHSPLVMYEILNEPGIANGRWGGIQQAAIDAIRAVDTKHTIVVTGGEFHSYNMRSLPEYTDNNLIYTFHNYGPMEFTHQGASWLGPALKELSAVPWPYDASRIPSPIPSRLENYHNSGTLAKLQSTFKGAVNFAEDRNVPVWCGEFGVYRKASLSEDRIRWLVAGQTYMEENNIAWSLWFGLFNTDLADEAHFNHDLDVDMMRALGLNPPTQVQWGSHAKTSAFDIYTDDVAEDIYTSVSTHATSEIDIYNDWAVEGSKSIYWRRAQKFNRISFHFDEYLDLSQLADSDYVFQFHVWCDTPGTNFKVKFYGSAGEASYVINAENLGIDAWDSQWYKTGVSLSVLNSIMADGGLHKVSFLAGNPDLDEEAVDDTPNAVFRLDHIAVVPATSFQAGGLRFAK